MSSKQQLNSKSTAEYIEKLEAECNMLRERLETLNARFTCVAKALMELGTTLMALSMIHKLQDEIGDDDE